MKTKLAFLALLSLALSSCTHLSGISGTLNVPLPERLGGGSLPITIHPAK